MKFLADINIPASSISLLNNLGHDVLDLKQKNLLAKDVEIIKLAKAENRIIVTRDKDFLELSKFPKYTVPLILISIVNQKFENITSHLKNLLENQDKDVLENSITIIKEGSAKSYPLSFFEN